MCPEVRKLPAAESTWEEEEYFQQLPALLAALENSPAPVTKSAAPGDGLWDLCESGFMEDSRRRGSIGSQETEKNIRTGDTACRKQ